MFIMDTLESIISFRNLYTSCLATEPWNFSLSSPILTIHPVPSVNNILPRSLFLQPRPLFTVLLPTHRPYDWLSASNQKGPNLNFLPSILNYNCRIPR